MNLMRWKSIVHRALVKLMGHGLDRGSLQPFTTREVVQATDPLLQLCFPKMLLWHSDWIGGIPKFSHSLSPLAPFPMHLPPPILVLCSHFTLKRKLIFRF